MRVRACLHVCYLNWFCCPPADRSEHEHFGRSQGALLLLSGAVDHPAPPHQARRGCLRLPSPPAHVRWRRRRLAHLPVVHHPVFVVISGCICCLTAFLPPSLYLSPSLSLPCRWLRLAHVAFLPHAAQHSTRVPRPPQPVLQLRRCSAQVLCEFFSPTFRLCENACLMWRLCSFPHFLAFSI